jgi:hypothetical protein
MKGDLVNGSLNIPQVFFGNQVIEVNLNGPAQQG